MSGPVDAVGPAIAMAHPVRWDVAVLVVLAVSMAVWWIYHQASPWKLTRRSFLAGLRLASLLTIGLVVLQPVLRSPAPSAAATSVAIGVDISASMALPDGALSRLDAARAQLFAADGMLTRLHQAGARVRLFSLGEQTREITEGDLPGLVAADTATDLGGAITTMAQAVRGQSGTAMILMTDAGDTTTQGPGPAATRALEAGTSVHVVGFGGAARAPDVSIQGVIAPPTIEVGANTQIQVEVGRSQYQGPVQVRLYRQDTFLAQATVPAGSEEVATCMIGVVPDQAGPLDLRVEAVAVPGETLLENNHRDVRVTAEDRRVDVLFVEGSPRHEFAFIRRTMANDRHFRLVTLLRLGHKRYADSGAEDGSVLSEGFPATAEGLDRFSAIILSDIEAAEFTSEQLGLIHDFVTVRGGGLLMLGGTNAFNLGGYAGTPIAELLPVRLDPDAVAPAFDDRQFNLSITSAGLEHEILRQGRSREATEAQWRLMPPLKGLNVLLAAKPGATVLAERTSPLPSSVVLAVQDAGAGRVAAFASANSWRWKMLRAVDDDSYRRFWSQMIRWLAVGNRPLLSLELSRQIVPIHQAVSLEARVLDATHRPCNQASVVASISDAQGHVQQLTLPWVLSEDGAYQAEWQPEVPGEVQIKVEATVAHGPPLSGAIALMAVGGAHDLQRPDFDIATARTITENGGGVLAEDGSGSKVVDRVLAQLGGQGQQVPVVQQHELADSPILLLVISVLLLAEWILRRKGGLPVNAIHTLRRWLPLLAPDRGSASAGSGRRLLRPGGQRRPGPSGHQARQHPGRLVDQLRPLARRLAPAAQRPLPGAADHLQVLRAGDPQHPGAGGAGRGTLQPQPCARRHRQGGRTQPG